MSKNKNHSVKYNFIMNFILTASNFIFPLITFPYVSRILSSAGYGRVNFVASVANYFLIVASLGIPTYGIKSCAKVRDDKDLLSRTAQEILIINLIATTLVTITFILCIFTIPRFTRDKYLFYINAVNIVLNMFGANWLYQALEQYDYITVRSIIFKAISVVLMFAFVHSSDDYLAYAATTVVASGGSNIFNFARLHYYITFKKKWKYNFKKHLKPIFILFAQSATISIYTNLDTVMLGFIKGDSEVGLYSAAVKVKTILVSVENSLGWVLLPRMSYYVQKKNKTEFHSLIIKALNAELFLSFPLCVYFIFEAKDSILFLAGNDFINATLAMQIINISLIPIGLTGVIGMQTLTPLNRENQVLISVIIGAVSDFILNLFFIPTWGSAGAALATTIAEILVLIAQMILGHDVVKGTFKKVNFKRYCIVTAISLFAMLLISFAHLNSSFIRLVVTALAFFGTYTLLLYFMKDELMYRLLDNRLTSRLIKK